MFTDILSGEVDFADICFLVAVVLAVIAAVTTVSRSAATAYTSTCGWVAVAFIALGLLAL